MYVLYNTRDSIIHVKQFVPGSVFISKWTCECVNVIDSLSYSCYTNKPLVTFLLHFYIGKTLSGGCSSSCLEIMARKERTVS